MGALGPLPLLMLACVLSSAVDYPETPRGKHVDVLHGVRVPDPYRWLEDVNSQRVRAWIAAQDELTFGYLGRIRAREAIRRRVETLFDYDKHGIPVRRGGRYSSRASTAFRTSRFCTGQSLFMTSRSCSSMSTRSRRTGPSRSGAGE